MALGDVIVLDDVQVEVSSDPYAGSPTYTDVTDAANSGRILIQYTVVAGRPTFGRAGLRRKTSKKYTYQLVLNFEVDAYGAGSINAIIGAAYPPPVGAGDGDLGFRITPASGSVSAANPRWSGIVAVNDFEPLGAGTADGNVVQDRTFDGIGDIAKAES